MGKGQKRSEQEREARWRSRADSFWGAFRFTENGRPKSGFGVYTFSLSLAFAAVYFGCYELAIRVLTGPLAGASAAVSNLVIALCASAVGAAVCCAPHWFFSDKRLVFGGHLWLCAYAVAVLVIMLVMLGFTGSYVSFLIFFGWFILPPVAIGTLASALLFRRDRGPARPAQPEPEWKKYVNRR